MLKAKTEEQKKQIMKIIGLCETCCNFPLKFDEEIDTALFNKYNDRVYIDGNVTFDQMAEIVDYLRKESRHKMARWAGVKSGIDGLWVAGDTIFLKDAKKEDAVGFIKSLGEFGYDTDALMYEYKLTRKITL